ncbi:helix-turn-helix domain-containing protein [Pseudonocardia benzenivorans]|uniref:Helix-turn-helix domain-containing protein n=1 Tax=Pseudonocardia benzenivorans TaxID=228005 RepID=A0ABW3VK01_9PSEU
MDLTGIEAAAQRFRRTGRIDPACEAVRPEVVASWLRAVDAGVRLDAVEVSYVGHEPGRSAVPEADEVFAAFFSLTPRPRCSVALVDHDGVVRVRHDGDPALAALLDGVLFTPGFRYAEGDVGTTAAALLHHGGDVARVVGAEHLHPELTWLAESAATVHRSDGAAPDAVVVLRHVADADDTGTAVAGLLAGRIAEAVADRAHRHGLLVHRRFTEARDAGAEWVLATDGDVLLTCPGVRRLGHDDQRSLADLTLAAAVIGEADGGDRHVDLPSGHCAALAVEPVSDAGVVVGCVVSGGPLDLAARFAVPEAVRRQGSHVAPTTRRDYAADLRGGDHSARLHAEARMRANRELLSPYLRACHEVAAAVGRRRHQLLIGEAGVGKQTLAVQQFRRAHPSAMVHVVDCSRIGDSTGGPDPLDRVAREPGDRPRLLVLRQMNLLSPVAARRLDESLRTLVAMPDPLVVAGCIDSASADATRPYGLLLRHFHETVRVPALRYRADELGDIAMSILHGLAGGRSLRLSMQVVRVLEGYAWPGNVRELEDVLRYVVARKPVGVIQAPDLPPSCFAHRAPRMSMLEAAQCDVIIQALYEARGNRYKAAEMLGIARSSLYRKIDAFGISYIG